MSGPLAVSVGDPAGIGPEVALRAALESTARVCLFGDAQGLAARARALGLDAGRLRRLERVDEPLDPGQVGVRHVGSWGGIPLGRATAEGGAAQRDALDAAAEAARTGAAAALVTGPTSKAAIVAAGTPFVGQTEHLARAAGLAADAVTMLFLGPRLRVGLVTTHLALRDVPGAVTGPRLVRTAVHLAEALRAEGASRPPTIAVAGLNPHAGEGGLFGDEEARVMGPALDAIARLAPFADGGARCVGVAPAEAVFRLAAAGEVDGVVAAFHDQATIASKLLDWGEAVNVTWGLPFVRTSVDHGVAYDLAATPGRADAGGMRAALALAARLAGGR